MNFKRVNSVMIAMLASVAVVSTAAAQSQRERLEAHMSAADRSDDDRQRDATRMPIDVIEFLGVEDGMTALDVIAAGGWYTGILSAAVGPDGKVYSQNPAFFLGREGFVEAEAARHAALGNVEALHGDVAGIDGMIDAAITNLNLHDIYNMGGAEAALGLLGPVFTALKPGGVFAVIDHRGIAGQPNADLHRMEADVARDLLVQAGFVVEAESMVLANAADDHTKGPGDPSLNGRSDKFLLKARKPR